MPYDAFSHVDHWVFDLDNTLYPPEVQLFDQIERLMAEYVMEELSVDEKTAHTLRKDYWHNHGTTLSGLMNEHNIDPVPFLKHVHNLDLSAIEPAPDLRAAIASLPGRKIIYTNGSREHGERVSAARGLNGVFDAIYGIEDADFTPKPKKMAFERVFTMDSADTKKSAMFEDDPRNLEAPNQMGMKTVLVGGDFDAPYIHFKTSDLVTFLQSTLHP